MGNLTLKHWSLYGMGRECLQFLHSCYTLSVLVEHESHSYNWRYPKPIEEELNMALGRYTTDLDKGDVLGPIDYTMSKFVVREYCHANELHQDCYQGKDVCFAPPTLVHLDKLKLYKAACPAGTGPTARIHYQYDATIHAPVPVGVPLRVSGEVTDRYLKKGREYVEMRIDLRTAEDDRPLITYRDTIIVSFSGKTSSKEQ